MVENTDRLCDYTLMGTVSYQASLFVSARYAKDCIVRAHCPNWLWSSAPCVIDAGGCFPGRVERPECGLSSTAEVNECRSNYTPPCTFKLRCLIKHRDHFALYRVGHNAVYNL